MAPTLIWFAWMPRDLKIGPSTHSNIQTSSKATLMYAWLSARLVTPVRLPNTLELSHRNIQIRQDWQTEFHLYALCAIGIEPFLYIHLIDILLMIGAVSSGKAYYLCNNMKIHGNNYYDIYNTYTVISRIIYFLLWICLYSFHCTYV